MTYNLRSIMMEAWVIVGRYKKHGYTDALPVLLSRALGAAWNSAKAEVYVAAKCANAQAERDALKARSAEALRDEIVNLENRDTIGADGASRLAELRSALRAAEARDEKRDLIASAAGRFCGVTFIKKDGSLREMRVQPASLKFHVKGDAATDAGRKGAETRATRHPNLMPVWDADKKAIRSVNLETVTRIAVGGRVHAFAA